MTVEEIIAYPFTWGLVLGLLVAGFILKNAIGTKMRLNREKRRLEKDLLDLQSHLNTQLKITASGNNSLSDEVEKLKQQNQVLQMNLATLQTKPDKKEQRQFHMQEMAVSTMREQAPGFAGAWEKAMRQAESDMESAEGGFKKLVRKVVPSLATSSRPTASDTRVIENSSD